MNTTFYNTARIAGAALLVLMAGAAMAQTQKITVDGMANCVNMSGGGTVSPVDLTLGAGTYSIKVTSSTVTFCADGACPNHAVALTFFDGHGHVGDTVMVDDTHAEKVVINDGLVWANILDTQCGDNAGQSVVQFKKHK